LRVYRSTRSATKCVCAPNPGRGGCAPPPAGGGLLLDGPPPVLAVLVEGLWFMV